MWWMPVAILIGLGTLLGAAVRLTSWNRRRKAARSVDGEPIVASARSVTGRVLVQRAGVFRGMTAQRANRTRCDLWLTRERFLLASGRGILLDLRASGGRRLSSVRCTGPGKLVLEGERPASQGPAATFRIELFVHDALEWVQRLSVYVDATKTEHTFGSFAGGSVVG